MKAIGRKNYGSIPHLPSSRIGPADHHCHVGQEIICTTKARDRHDQIIILEKLDGTNVGIARHNGKILALTRAGYLAETSPYEQHRMFSDWVRDRESRFMSMLDDGERLVGEWLAQAHGTRYSLPSGPFVAFDLISGDLRTRYSHMLVRCISFDIRTPGLLHIGGPLPVAEAMARHAQDNEHGWHEDDGPEGVVYRVERMGRVDFLAKWVRPDKVDGKYLPGVAGNAIDAPEIWNWKPARGEDL